MPDSTANIEDTVIEQYTTEGRFKDGAAMDQTDTLICGENLISLPITSVSAVSEDFEDACAFLPTVSTQPATERQSDDITGNARKLVEDVEKSVGKDCSDVDAVHTGPVDGEESEKIGHMDHTDIQVTTVCEVTDVSSRALVTTGISNDLDGSPDDSDDTATIVLTPERSANSTTYAGSVDDCVEQIEQASDIQVPATDEHSSTDQQNGLPDSEIDTSTDPLSEQIERTSETSITSEKAKALTTTGDSPIAPILISQETSIEDSASSTSTISPAIHNFVESDADLEGLTQTKVTELSAIDSRKSDGSESPTRNLEHNTDSSGESTEPESRKGVSLMAAAVRSVPPHLRQQRSTPQQYTAPVARGNWASPLARASRTPHQNYRAPVDGNEHAHLSAQLMKTRDELQAARKENADMRMRVENEKQESLDAAMSGLLTDLLHRQSEALALMTKAREKQRELRYREQKIEQLEAFLAEGQKQFHYELDKRGIQSMSEVEVQRIRSDVKLEVKQEFASAEGRLADLSDRIRQQESILHIREQQYKATIRNAVARETKENMALETQRKTGDINRAEAEYQRGFAEGRGIGRTETTKEIARKQFLDGYVACNRAQTVLHNLRHGRIPTDSKELAFLFDPAHEENLFSMGREIGMQTRCAEDVDEGQVQETASKSAADNKATAHPEPEPEPKPEPDPEAVYISPPRSQTFASKLRGAATTHNGHVVLANRGPVQGGGVAKVESKVVNLIDF